MTQQLRRAMIAAGPDEVERTRRLLVAAGEAALAHSSMRCLIYAGLHTATAGLHVLGVDDEDWPDPLLLAAVMAANERAPGTASRVGEELDEVWIAYDDKLVYALILELLMASCQAMMVLDKAEEELEDFNDLGDWGGQ